MTAMPDNILLKSVTGLEGGVVASGSSCGVVTGGALSLGLFFNDHVREQGARARAGVLDMVGEYVRFFENTYGSQICRQRSGADFYTIPGQLRYFLPGDRMARCFSHIHGAMKYLDVLRKQEPPQIKGDIGSTNKAVHCAPQVLQSIREKTGASHITAEQVSYVLDGGVGFSGGVCGAIAGAIMGMNLVWGIDIRALSFFQTVKPFLIGHANLLSKKQNIKPETFIMGKRLLETLKKEAGSLECRAITGKTFDGWNDFQDHVCGSAKCRELMDLAANRAAEAIKAFEPG